MSVSLTLALSLAACGGSKAPAPPTVDPASGQVSATATVGGTTSATVTFKNAGGSDLKYTASVSYPNGKASGWLNFSGVDAAGTVKAGASKTVTANLLCQPFVGAYAATITLSSADGKISKAIPVVLNCVAEQNKPEHLPVLTAMAASDTVTVNHVTITGTATDNVQVQKVTYKLNDGDELPVAGAGNAKSVALNFTVSGLRENLNTIMVRAYDTSGLITEVPVQVTYNKPVTEDVTAPQLLTTNAKFEKYQRDDATSGYRVMITGTGQDNVSAPGNLRVLYALDGVTFSEGNAVWADGAFTLYANDVNTSVEGTHHVTVKLVDEAGNESDIASPEFVTDVTAPQASVDQSGWITVNSTTVTGTITETNFSSAQWTFGDQAGSLSAADISAEGTFSVVLNSVPEGTNDFTLTVADKAGNTGNAAGSVKADFSNPTAGAITANPSEFFVPGNVSLSLPADDAISGVVSVNFFRDGSTTPIAATKDPTSGQWTASDVVETSGTLTYTATVTDTAGNSTTTAGVSVTAKTPAPPVISNVSVTNADRKGNSTNWGVTATIVHDSASVTVTIMHLDAAGTTVIKLEPPITISGTDFSGMLHKAPVGDMVQLKVEDGVNTVLSNKIALK